MRRRVVEAPHATTIFAFELKLLTDLGLKPDLDQSNLNPGNEATGEGAHGEGLAGSGTSKANRSPSG